MINIKIKAYQEKPFALSSQLVNLVPRLASWRAINQINK